MSDKRTVDEIYVLLDQMLYEWEEYEIEDVSDFMMRWSETLRD